MSALEGGRRSVTVDELFGLAISFGVTVGRLFDPSGPDGTRNLGLDVGLGSVGHSSPLTAQLARLFASSRAVIHLVDEDTGMIDIDTVPDVRTPTLDELGAGVDVPVRKRRGSTPGT